MTYWRHEPTHVLILDALRAFGFDKRANLFATEISNRSKLDSAFRDYVADERAVFRKVRGYCESNIGVIHDWIHRGFEGEG